MRGVLRKVFFFCVVGLSGLEGFDGIWRVFVLKAVGVEGSRGGLYIVGFHRGCIWFSV